MRRIKDPFYKDVNFIDFTDVLATLNMERRQNGLAPIGEDFLEFNKSLFIAVYCEMIKAKNHTLSTDETELWYEASLETIKLFRKRGIHWDWGELQSLVYVSNYDELCTLETKEDLISKASDLTDQINNQLYKYGGRSLGASYGGVHLIELNGQHIRYKIDTDKDFYFKAGFEPNEENLKLLTLILNEVS